MNPRSDKFRLAVVVVTYGSHHLLESNLGRMSVDEAADGVVIVDNLHSSGERTAIRALTQQRGWTFLAMDANIGFGAAVNHGVSWAFSNGFDVALILNPDAFVEPAVVRSLLDECRIHPDALIAPVILRSDRTTWFSGGAMDGRSGDVTGTARYGLPDTGGWVSGACFLVHKGLWERIGGFDPRYFLYWEDVDLSWRAVAAGGVLLVRHDLTAFHDPGGTQKGTGKSALYYYYNCRNRLLFAGRNLPARTALGWLLRTPGASKRILYRGGRRQMVVSLSPLVSAVGGSLVGAAFMMGTLSRRASSAAATRLRAGLSSDADRQDRTDLSAVRVYASLRTAHLERFRSMTPAKVLYNRTRYDFDETLVTEESRPRRLSRWGIVRDLFLHDYDVVELNEPLMTGRWPDLMAQTIAVRVRSLLRRRRTRVVTYCIGYADPADDIAARRPIPRIVARLWAAVVATSLAAMTDRLAFGTAGSLDLYGRYVPKSLLTNKARLFEALPSPCACLKLHPAGDDRSSSFVFLGSFDDRKGIRVTLRLWERLSAERPEWTLRVLGKGPLTDAVLNWAADRREVTVELDPPRDRIHEVLRSSGTLVLLSQRVGAWREQIGLPIVEGLAHGCEIVTTSETGLAAWLESHGHVVVEPGVRMEGLAPAILRRALVRQRLAVVADLPDADQRIAADRWLMSGDSESRSDHMAWLTA